MRLDRAGADRKDEKLRIGRLLEALYALALAAKQCRDLRRSCIADIEPDNLRREAFHEAALSEVSVIGGNRESLGTGVLPNQRSGAPRRSTSLT